MRKAVTTGSLHGLMMTISTAHGAMVANSVGNDLHSWSLVHVGCSGIAIAMSCRKKRLYRSTNHGETWGAADWAFTRNEHISIPSIRQFGGNYSGARNATLPLRHTSARREERYHSAARNDLFGAM
jgi:hypothetical protein